MSISKNDIDGNNNNSSRLTTVACGCGCNEMIPAYDKKGRVKRFVSGHQNRKFDYSSIKKVKCACGCGEDVEERDGRFRKKIYKTGHIAKNKILFFERGKDAVLKRQSLTRAKIILDLLNVPEVCMVNDRHCTNTKRGAFKVEVCHWDGDIFNNSVDNLGYLCLSHNRVKHFRKIGTLGDLKNLVLDYTVDRNGNRRYRW